MTGRRQSYKANPEWIDRILEKHWDAIRSAVGEKMMPAQAPGVMIELGCGAWGCVLPTLKDDVVVKITTDASEAAFATAAMELAEKDGWPKGIVRYHGVFGLPEKYGSPGWGGYPSKSPKPVYLLWRQEAEHVGALVDTGARTAAYAKRWGLATVDAFVSDLNDFLLEALDIFDLLDETENSGRRRLLRDAQKLLQSGTRGKRQSDPEKVAHCVLVLAKMAQALQSSDVAPLVGEALGYYLDKGFALADVHAGNIGEVKGNLVITDPGMMVPVDPDWLAVDIPMVA